MRVKPFPPSFYAKNRERLRKALPPGSMALLFNGRESTRNADQLHPFRPDSNFWYLTGIEEPSAKLLLLPWDADQAGEMLFLPSVDPKKEQWEGRMTTLDQGKTISGIEAVKELPGFESILYSWQRHRDMLYSEVNPVFPRQPLTSEHLYLAEIGKRLPGLQLKKIDPLMRKLRAKKQPPEIKRQREALGIMNRGLRRVMQGLSPDMMEYQVEAQLVHQYLDEGCDRLGFEVIVAGGENACILHYVENSSKLKSKDLVLIDTGAEYGMYSGDITRVFPVNGKFTPPQAKAYQCVLDVNEAMISEVKAGMSWKEISDLATKIQAKIYKKAGYITDEKKLMEVALHRIGHSLGLDVHDLQHPEEPLPVGAVITIEPGIYLKDQGIGIRIEDNVLLTKEGCEVLSQDLPKQILEIEEIMGKR